MRPSCPTLSPSPVSASAGDEGGPQAGPEVVPVVPGHRGRRLVVEVGPGRRHVARREDGALRGEGRVVGVAPLGPVLTMPVPGREEG